MANAFSAGFQALHPAVADRVEVLDAVGAGGHACHEGGNPGWRAGSGRRDRRVGDLDFLVRQFGQARLFGQCHHGYQSCARYEVGVIGAHCPHASTYAIISLEAPSVLDGLLVLALSFVAVFR
jgi:hypothetical protein